MLLKFIKFVLSSAILVFPITIPLVAGDCEPLPYREHVTVICEEPGTKDTLKCHAGELPNGTIGNYHCVKNYYVPTNEDIEGGKLICSSGKWIGGPQFLDFSCTVSCGIQPLKRAVGFVIGGTEAQRELWPWHASIYARRNTSEAFRYICGGSLIKPYSKGFVILTAAHCLADLKGKARDVNNVKVVLGGEFSTLEEHADVPDAQILTVREIVLHESYEGASLGYSADIAVMAVDDVKLSNTVLPACFGGADETEVGALGEIVGFGRYNYDSDAVSLVLRNVSLPVVEPDLCNEWRRRKLQPGEICAGYENSQSVCNGDSGGGFTFIKGNANGVKRYYVQGIVSHGRRDIEDQKETCDSYSVFTKVNTYTKWIRETAVALFTPDDEESALSPTLARVAPILGSHPPTVRTPTERTSLRALSSEETTETIQYTITIPRLKPKNPEPLGLFPIPGHRPHNSPLPSFPTQHQLQGYELKSLQRHNYYRRMHEAPDLRPSVQMKQRAQAYADKLIREGTFANENEKGINKNVYYVTGSGVRAETAAGSAVDSWYEEIESYNWDNPYYNTFSQVVWKGTTDIGTGIATDGRRTIVVVAYSPPGNILGENGRFFRENVSPKQ